MKFSFLGGRMSQSAKAISLWESILTKVPFARIIEIGTQSGNFSYFLYLFCKRRGATFWTFDIKDQRDSYILDIVSSFHEMDVFSDVPFVGGLITCPGITVLFCDGGNKEKEFNTFVKFLKSGDIIAVHDWNKEAKPENLKLSGLVELESEQSDEEGWTRFFQKK